MKLKVETPNAPNAKAFLSQAILTENLVFVSGQINNTTDGQMVGNTVTEKVKQIMNNISEILKAAELDLNDIVKATIYVTDMSQMKELNEVYPTYFTEPFPAREAICVKELPLGATIEISVIATKN